MSVATSVPLLKSWTIDQIYEAVRKVVVEKITAEGGVPFSAAMSPNGDAQLKQVRDAKLLCGGTDLNVQWHHSIFHDNGKIMDIFTMPFCFKNKGNKLVSVKEADPKNHFTTLFRVCRGNRFLSLRAPLGAWQSRATH